MNFITQKHLNRRTVLKGLGATVALPLLDAMTPARAFAQPKKLRMVAMEMVHGAAGSTAFGLQKNLWAPAATGSAFDLSPTAMAPLEPWREYITIVSNTDVRMVLTALDSDAVARAVAQALDWAAQPGHSVITLADETYPPLLLEIPDPPAVLYARGRTELLASPALAIVGSRNATQQGEANAEALGKALSAAGLTIVSGLALGIDAAAHRGGLAGTGSTIAVLGTGIDVVYPSRNAALATEIAGRGLLVSEFPLGTAPAAQNFPRRNRLISGLARGCLVVEAALASGSLITARAAAEQGREVFAIPGSIHSPLAKGCHALIKSGAKLVESAEDVLAELSGFRPSGYASTTRAAPETQDAGLLRHMGHDPVDVDSLCSRAGMSAEQVSSELLRLELDGRVAALPGGLYQRLEKGQRR